MTPTVSQRCGGVQRMNRSRSCGIPLLTEIEQINLVGWHLRALPLSNERVVLSSCLSHPAPLMGTDLAAILISSVFLGVGSVIAKFFPEASLMAAVFLIGLAILNITLALLA